MKWINGYERKWDCEHVNKCDVLMEWKDNIFIYCTDYPELDGNYRYIFMNDLLDGYIKNNRDPMPCDCKREIEGENNDTTLYIQTL